MTSDPKRGPSRPQREPGPQQPRGASSPAIVFAILLTVVAVVSGAALLLGSEPAQQPATAASSASPSPTNSSPTNDQAIEELRELEALSFEALEKRDRDLAVSLYAPNSPLRKGAVEDIVELKRNNTVVDVRSRTVNVTVERATSTEIRLRQVAVIRTRFTRVDNRENAGGRTERQTIRWTLRRHGNGWLIHDAVVVAAEEV